MNQLRSRIIECLGFLAVLSAAACNRDECRLGAHECDGNVAVNCSLEGEQAVLHHYPCDTSTPRCVDAEETAFCAQGNASLDAQCEGEERSEQFCGGKTTLLTCREGYAVNFYDCESGGPGGECVEDGYASCEWPEPEPEPELPACNSCEGQFLQLCSSSGERWENDCGGPGQCIQSGDDAYCAESSEPDPRCVTPDGSFCADGVHLFCTGGYVTHSEDCGAPERCIQMDTTNFCALSGTPDELCTSRSDGTKPNVFCEDNATVLCFAGYRLSKTPCDEGSTCVEHADTMGATCEM